MRRSAAKMKQTMKDKTYRAHVVKHLSSFIQTDTRSKLLLGSEDEEIALSFFHYKKKHICSKCIHIDDALKMLVLHTVKEKAITWIECCRLAIDKNYGIIKFSRTVAN